tara:strand:+ start:574 stop:786 length:213 start_codon:yes stop_codon:yes gene_type:complete
MKIYNIRAENKQIGYYSIKAKSLEEAKAQALYQLQVKSTVAVEICESVEIPSKVIVIDHEYLELTGKEKS